MSIKKLLFLMLSMLLVAAINFAPREFGIALNHETKQCAGYWGGDEFVTYELPVGWKAFEFEYLEDSIVVKTDIGTCKVAKDEVVNFAYEEPCCSQLGYTFVSENIGIRKITSFNLTQQAAILTYEATKENKADAESNSTPTSNHVIYYVVFSVLAMILLISVITLIRRTRQQ